MFCRTFRKRKAGAAALLLVLLATFAVPTAAHDIPPNVNVIAYVKPEGQSLQVMLRVPLAAMRDMTLPQTGPGYVIISQADEEIREAANLWLAGYLAIFEDGEPLGNPVVSAARIEIPGNRSFATYEGALANTLSPPLSDNLSLMWNQALLDVILTYPIRSETSHFSIDPGLEHLGLTTNTTLHFLPPNGSERIYQYVGYPGLVQLDPRWHQAALSFVKLGFEHILDGIDHLLFVFCLVIPFRRLRPLVAVITSFTVAHSITLIASAFGLAPRALWFPPLIETLIALSIVYMALENIAGPKLQRRWVVAFGFGLVHGFGFSFVLSESLQFAGSHLLLSLLSFNVGVEIGQVFVLLLMVPLLELLFRRFVAERVGTIILSALVAHTAWHWMLDRGTTLRAYDFIWPSLNAAFMITAMRWSMLLLIIVGVGWILSELSNRLVRSPRTSGPGIENTS
jgi:hypothetical protein